MISRLRYVLIAAGLLAAVSPASADWTPISAVPASTMFTVGAKGDTIVAGADTSVFVSTNGGASWKGSSKPTAKVAAIDAVLMRNGRLYAGTLGQGVFISDDLGTTWQAFNEGLVGGIVDSQLDIADFAVRGDNLFAATLGAGVYVRNLAAAGTWSHFGEEFEPNQASNVNAIALGGTRLVAGAGGNGSVFFRDPGDAEWTISWLDNVGLRPGVQAQSVAWTGNGWLVGTAVGVFSSHLGQEPWTRTDLGLGTIVNSSFATGGAQVFAAFDIVNPFFNGVVIEQTGDDGANWQIQDILPGLYVYRVAMVGNDLYAARADGLWRNTVGTASVASSGGPGGVRFALAGRQPVGDDVHFRFELPEGGTATIEVFDVAGRRTGDRLLGSWPAGAHEVSWSARGLAPGVFLARLTAGARQEVVRLVHVR
jgi:hypothetical protein